MYSNLLAVPYRLVEAIDLKGELKSLLARDYQRNYLFDSDLELVQKLHSESATPHTDASVYVESLQKYHAALLALDANFPGLSFTWFGTLGFHPKKCTVGGWNLERLQVVFQLGAAYSQLACEADSGTDAGITLAVKNFRLLAGCFKHLKGKCDILDFDTNTLETLEKLMLAQAQEAFWRKAMASDMKSRAIAKLATSVWGLYEQALYHAPKAPSVTLNWINHITTKKLHFQAVLAYRMSMAAMENVQHGEQVAYLQVAAALCAEAKTYLRYVNDAVRTDLDGLVSVVDESLRSAEKENNFVYLQPVPLLADLETVMGSTQLSATEPLFIKDPPLDVFSSLVPYAVIQVGQAFESRNESFMQSHLGDVLESLDRSYKRFLAEQDLPAALDAILKPENIPESIVEHLQEIVGRGGLDTLEGLFAQLELSRCDCSRLVAACGERVDDEIVRHNAGDAEQLSILHSRIAKMKLYLEQGSRSDEILLQEYLALRPTLDIYCGGHELLAESIPHSDYVHIEGDLGESIEELKGLLKRGTDLCHERDQHLERLRVKVNEHDLKKRVIEAFERRPLDFKENGDVVTAKFEPLFEKHVESYKPDFAFVKRHTEAQKSLETQITDAHARFKEASTYTGSQKERLDALQHFEEVHVRYLDLVAHLRDGARFYGEFIRKGDIVLEACDKFLYARREESRHAETQSASQGHLRVLHAPQGRRADGPFRI